MSGISDENPKSEKIINSFKNMDNSPNDKSKIKRKIRAWCSLCFQFFENGPTTKNCQEHLRKGNCNLIKCKKGIGTCIRKFANTNSENRHTYCLSQEEVSNWDPIYDIQLSLKAINEFSNLAHPNLSLDKDLKSNDYIGNSLSKIISQDPNNYRLLRDETKGGYFEDINSSNNIIKPEYIHSPNLSMVYGKQEYFEFEENDEEKIIYDLSNIYIDSKNDKQHIEEKQDTYLPSENQIQIQPETNKFFENSQTKNYLIKDETEISELLDMVQADLKVAKTSINKLKSAFKKKGWTVVKIIRIYKKKANNWDFLKEEFKDVCPQISGIALYLEDILDK